MTALATLLLPYSLHYDAVALIPALLSAWDVTDGAQPRWEGIMLGAAALVLILAPLIPLVAPQTPVRLVPVGLLLLAALSLLRPARTGRTPFPPVPGASLWCR